MEAGNISPHTPTAPPIAAAMPAAMPAPPMAAALPIPAPITVPPQGSGECRALGQIIDRIGDKWTVMVVGHLSQGTLRFSELMRAIPGVSHRMLTLTLRGLQRDGLVSRTAFPTVPPRVDYALTELGFSLTGPLTMLAHWASANKLAVEEARVAYDAAREGE